MFRLLYSVFSNVNGQNRKMKSLRKFKQISLINVEYFSES